jgi:two-component system chemotaxis response regulator CheY
MKILVVDDERDVEALFRQRFRKELKAGELDFKFVFSAEEALEYLRQLSPFDLVLVLSDINMPGMTGLELLKIVKNQFPHLQVFMISAYGDDDNHSTAKNYGADDFVTKPVDFTNLRDKILALRK